MTWAATEAKAKFSEMLTCAETRGPQLVRRRNRDFFVLTREQLETHSIAMKEEAASFVSGWEALAPKSGAAFDVEFPRLRNKARAMKF